MLFDIDDFGGSVGGWRAFSWKDGVDGTTPVSRAFTIFLRTGPSHVYGRTDASTHFGPSVHSVCCIMMSIVTICTALH